jgi:hypothetical protein
VPPPGPKLSRSQADLFQALGAFPAPWYQKGGHRPRSRAKGQHARFGSAARPRGPLRPCRVRVRVSCPAAAAQLTRKIMIPGASQGNDHRNLRGGSRLSGSEWAQRCEFS